MPPVWMCSLLGALVLCLATTRAADERFVAWATLRDGPSAGDLAMSNGLLGNPSGQQWRVNSLSFDAETASNITGLTFHYQDQTVYMSEARTQTIFRFKTNDFNETVFHKGFGNHIQIAMDWSVGNLYWVDYLFEWVAVKPRSSLDVYDFKVLFDLDVEFPYGIAVDPVHRYVFWSELGTTPKIRRIGLDGADPQVVAVGGMFQPLALTTDPLTGRVFWMDRYKESVEHCDSDGSRRGVDLKVRGIVFAGIAYHQNIVYVTAENIRQILGIEEGRGLLKSHVPDVADYGSPKAVIVFAPEVQPNVTDSCVSQNCAHFCLPGRFGEGNCFCQDGYTLQPDGRSCSGTFYSPRLLTYANSSHVCVIIVTAVLGAVPPEVACPVTDGQDITAIAADSGRRRVYYADRGRQGIYSVSLNTGLAGPVVNNAGRVEGLAFNWLTNTLYWSNSADREINLFSLESNIVQTLVRTNGEIGHITLDPYTQKLFWLSRNPDGIKSTDLNGGRETTLVSAGIKLPASISVHTATQTIYWTAEGSIQSVRENGTNQRQAILTSDKNNKALLVYKRFLFWSSSDPNYIHSGNTVHLRHERKVAITDSEIVDLDILDTAVQGLARGVCYNNGGCDHYCLPQGVLRQCGCELGFELQTDGQTCTTDIVDTNFLLVADGMAKRLYQLDLSTDKLSALSIMGMNSFSSAGISPVTRRLFWSEPKQRAIMAAELDGSAQVKVIDTGTHAAERLVIDPASGNVYYTALHPDTARSHNQSYVAVVSPDGTKRKTLVSGLGNIRAIQLYSSKGLMFWSQYDSSPRIERADMDGSQRSAIITTDIRWPNGIAIDYLADKLYWTDGHRDTIERCTLFGADRTVIHSDKGAHLMAVSLHGDSLFYTAWNRRGVSVLNKADGSQHRLITESPLFVRLDDITVFGTLSEFIASVSCQYHNGGCSSLCLPTSGGHICACPDKVELLSDGRTCKGEEAGDEPIPNSTVITSVVSSVCVVVVLVIFITAVLLVRKRKYNRQLNNNNSVVFSADRNQATIITNDPLGHIYEPVYDYLHPVQGSPPPYTENPLQNLTYFQPTSKEDVYLHPRSLTGSASGNYPTDMSHPANMNQPISMSNTNSTNQPISMNNTTSINQPISMSHPLSDNDTYTTSMVPSEQGKVQNEYKI